MDEPIIYSRCKPCYRDRRLYGPTQMLHVALTTDDKDLFMSLIKDPELVGQVGPSYIATKLFLHDAFEIATAVFNGEAKGFIDFNDELKDGLTPLHLAAKYGAPKLTNYLLQRGYNVDAVCDHQKLNLKHATPIDLSTSDIFINECISIFNVLWWVCFHNRGRMEAIRMLVRSNQNATWARQAFLKYAHNGELLELTALFLAVPELFLSSPQSESSWLSKLDLKLENKTLPEKQLSLLLDVFALVGHELAAYIRLEEFAVKSASTKTVEHSHLEIDFFLREVARKKLGVTSPDYYLSFFEVIPYPEDLPEWIDEDDEDDEFGRLPDWIECTSKLVGAEIFHVLPHFVTREDVDRSDIYRLTPSLEHQDAARLARAIEKKLLPVAVPSLETGAKTSKVQPFHTSAGTANPMFRSFHTSAGSANPIFGVKFTATKNWENKVMQSSKLKSFFDFVKLSQFPLVAKRLLK